MRSFAAPPVPLLVVGLLAWSCSIYESGLVPGGGGLTGDGGDSAMGGSKSAAGSGSMSTSGKSTTAGSAPVGEGGGSAGGTEPMPQEGGQGNEAGDENGGRSGAGGSQSGGTGGASSGAGAAAAGSGGGGGTGGVPPMCAEHPISAKTMWAATASASSLGNGMESDGLYNPPAHLIDEKLNERWSSGKAQLGDEWIEIDFGVEVSLSNVTLNVGNDTGDYPRAYAVRVSNAVQDFAAPVRAMGNGMTGNTVISLPSPVTGRYLLVRQTGMNAPMVTSWWTISEVLVSCQD